MVVGCVDRFLCIWVVFRIPSCFIEWHKVDLDIKTVLDAAREDFFAEALVWTPFSIYFNW